MLGYPHPDYLWSVLTYDQWTELIEAMDPEATPDNPLSPEQECKLIWAMNDPSYKNGD